MGERKGLFIYCLCLGSVLTFKHSQRMEPLRGQPLKKSKRKNGRKRKSLVFNSSDSVLAYHTELSHLKKTVQHLQESLEKTNERQQDLEIHVNLLTRLLTTLCIEKFGMRIGVLKRLIKRIEKEAIRDSQILHLEEIYKLPPHSDKKGPAPQPPSKNDPWEEIS